MPTVRIDGVTVHASVTTDRLVDACERRGDCLDNPGICVACGEDADECDSCGERAVYGVEELLIEML